MAFNVLQCCVAVLLIGAWVQMVVSIIIPQWSAGDYFRAGLWENCATNPDNSWYCDSVREPFESDPMFITVRVCTIWGMTTAFFASVLACIACAKDSRFIGLSLLALIAMSFVLLSIAFGCWLGVHNKYYAANQMNLALKSSFIMTCIAAGFCFIAFYLAFFGLFVGRKVNRHRRAKKARKAAANEPALYYDNPYTAPLYPTPAPLYPVVETAPYVESCGAPYYLY